MSGGWLHSYAEAVKKMASVQLLASLFVLVAVVDWTAVT